MSYHFKVGQLECNIFSDGYLSLPGEKKMDLNILLIRSGGRTILVDTGTGISPQAGSGKLLENLAAEGIKASNVDIVIHTHGHSDHVGGNTDAQGRPVFTNARHVIHKKEWDFWMARLKEKNIEPGMQTMMVEVARKNLLPLKDRFDFVESKLEILPGIRFLLAPGHTPGNILLMLASGTQQLLCIGDLVHDPQEFLHPEMYKMIDSSPDEAYNVRVDILSRAAKDKLRVFACHFDFPGLGRVGLKGDVLTWRAAAKRGS